MSDHSEAVEHVGGTTITFSYVWMALLGLSIIKAALIIAYFMHLKFERLSLFLTLFPMLVLCIVLMLMIFMPDSVRSLNMRVVQ